MWFFGGLFRDTEDLVIRCVIVALEPFGTLGLLAGVALLFPSHNRVERLARYYRFVLVVLILWFVVGFAIAIVAVAR
jgi:hypothetical protein